MSLDNAIAIYARVSSEQQARQHTIASQLAALEERVRADGLQCPEAFTFIDDGYSGATLLRPALERLRDQVAAGLIGRLYVHSPDRLARRYAYQVLLIDECKRQHTEVVFLNHEIGKSPEDDMLLQMQGMMAEYERAKILERCRRGKLHAARRGCVSVLRTARGLLALLDELESLNVGFVSLREGIEPKHASRKVDVGRFGRGQPV